LAGIALTLLSCHLDRVLRALLRFRTMVQRFNVIIHSACCLKIYQVSPPKAIPQFSASAMQFFSWPAVVFAFAAHLL
jgi:hypothetical protein